jgi:hypothetical protein
VVVFIYMYSGFFILLDGISNIPDYNLSEPLYATVVFSGEGDGQYMSGSMPGLDDKDSLAHNSSNNTSSGNTGSGNNTGASQGDSGGPDQSAARKYVALESNLQADMNKELDDRGGNGARNSAVILRELRIKWTNRGEGTIHYTKYPELASFAENYPDVVKKKGNTKVIDILAMINVINKP